MLVIFNQSGSLFNIDYQNDSFSQGDNNVHTIDVIVDEQGFKNGRYNCYIQFLREGETEPSPKLIMANKIIAYNDTRYSGFSFQMASDWYTAIAGVLKATIEIKEYSDDTLVSNKAYGVVNIPINESVSSDTGTTITDEEYNSMVSLINTKVGNSGSQNIEGFLSVDDGISTNEIEVGDSTFIDDTSITTLKLEVSISTTINETGIFTNEISVGPNDQVLINENGIAANGAVNSASVNTKEIEVDKWELKNRTLKYNDKIVVMADSVHNSLKGTEGNVYLGNSEYHTSLISKSRPEWEDANNVRRKLATLDDFDSISANEIETPIVRTNQIYNSNGNHVYSSQEDMTGNTDGIMGFGSEECEVRIRASGRPKIDVDGTYKELATLDDIPIIEGNYATLDENGKVPSSQLPGYVDDVVEYASLSEFPATGESGKIYLATSTNKSYRWSGTQYVEIASSIALGETSSTAYPGNKGKANADAISELQSNKADVSFVPTKVSQLTNDLGFLTQHQDISGKADKTELFSKNYNDLTNKPTIPTRTSELTNDSGFISSTQATQPTWNGQELLIMDDLYKRKEFIQIPAGTNLNIVQYLAPGVYTGNGNTLTNCPTTGAFIMEVWSYGLPPNDDEQTETWVYRLRKITDYQGNMYIQTCNSGATAGTFIYNAWREENGTASGGTSTPTGYPISDTQSLLTMNTLGSDLEGLEYDNPEQGLITYECISNKGIRLMCDGDLRIQETLHFLMHDKPIYFEIDTTIAELVGFQFDCIYDDIAAVGFVFVGFSEDEKSGFTTRIDSYSAYNGKAGIYFYDITIPGGTLIRYDKYSNIIYIENCIYAEN